MTKFDPLHFPEFFENLLFLTKKVHIDLDIYQSNKISARHVVSICCPSNASRIGVIDEINGDPSSWLKAIPLEKTLTKR